MGRLKRMQDMVTYLLEKYPKTRDDDRLLIGAVYACFYNVDVANATFKEVLLNDRLPNFETIRRCRQKIQEQNEDLRGTKAKEKKRLNAQKEYIEYATEV